MAKKLLVTTTLSITEISGRAGFGSQSYFGDYFRRITGVSPRQYRINGNEKTENKKSTVPGIFIKAIVWYSAFRFIKNVYTFIISPSVIPFSLNASTLIYIS